MENTTTARLTELAEQKLHLLTQLRELSFDQVPLASSQSVDELLALLSRKNELIDQIRLVQDELIPFQAERPEDRVWQAESERLRCRELFARCERTVSELLALEDQSLNELQTHRDLVGQQLHRFSSAEAIQDAYGTASAEGDSADSFLSLDG